MVDSVQADSSGSDKSSNPLQLALSYIVLEDDVIGEVHAAHWLQSSGALAADWDATVLGISFDSQSLGHGALVVFHPGQNLAEKLVKSRNTLTKIKFLQILKIRFENQIFFKELSGSPAERSSGASSCCLVSPCVSTVLPLGLFILSVRLF